MNKVTQKTIYKRLAEKFPGFQPDGDLESLTGGLLNYVWRVTGTTGSESQKLIVKWAPPYIASAPDVPLDPCRLMIETSALESFTPEGPLATVDTREVRPPHLYHYVPRENLLFMEDVGRFSNLASWLHDNAVTERDIDNTLVLPYEALLARCIASAPGVLN